MIVVRLLRVVPAVHLGEVVVLEGGVEVFEEPVEGNDRLIGQVWEDEGVGVVVHQRAPVVVRRGGRVCGAAKSCR